MSTLYLSVLFIFIRYVANEVASTGSAEASQAANTVQCAECNLSSFDHRLESIKEYILKEFGLTGPPKVNLNHEQMNDVIRHVQNRKRQFEFERTHEHVHVISNSSAEQADDPHARFELVKATLKRTIDRVTVAVFLRKPSSDVACSQDDEVTVKIYQKDNRTRWLTRLLGTAKTFIPSRDEGKMVYVHPSPILVKEMMDETNGVFDIYAEAIVDGQNLVIHPQDADSQRKKMMLTLTAKIEEADDDHVIQKREAIEDVPAAPQLCAKDRKPSAACCLRDLTVDFRKAGWQFVMEPLTFNAYTCAGDCSVDPFLPDPGPHYRILLSAYEKKHGKKKAICCHPTGYQSLDVAILNQYGEVVWKTMDRLVVHSCGCS